MAAGRLAWGAVMVILTMGSGNAFTLAAFWAGAVANAIPGIILQLAAVPALVMAVKPMTAQELGAVFCDELVKQELDNEDRYIEIPQKDPGFL